MLSETDMRLLRIVEKLGKKPGELIWGFLFIDASPMMNAIVDTVRGLA